MGSKLSRPLLTGARLAPFGARCAVALARSRFAPERLSRHWLVQQIEAQLGSRSPRENWTRTVMYRECLALVERLDPSRLEMLEVSPGASDVWAGVAFRGRAEVHYPEFDLCRDRLPRTFDLIIADQVFEHLLWPYRAIRNVHAMLKENGHVLISTPFLIRLHDGPQDCSRWTETGLKYFLAEGGFRLDRIRTGSWGNRACVKAALKRWPRQRWFRSLRNEADCPVAVWALAQK